MKQVVSKEKTVSDIVKSQLVPEEKTETEDVDELLRILELLERKSNENERELDAHKRMLNIMVGSGQGKVNFLEEENGEKEELRIRAQIRENILINHKESEQMKEKLIR